MTSANAPTGNADTAVVAASMSAKTFFLYICCSPFVNKFWRTSASDRYIVGKSENLWDEIKMIKRW